MTISGPCPSYGSALKFTPNGRYGRVAASCAPCGEDYGLSPFGVGRLGTTPRAGNAPTMDPQS